MVLHTAQHTLVAPLAYIKRLLHPLHTIWLPIPAMQFSPLQNVYRRAQILNDNNINLRISYKQEYQPLVAQAIGTNFAKDLSSF